MLLCLDIGNSHIFGGVFVGKEVKLKFRHPTHVDCTSDQIGLFLRQVLRENQFDPDSISKIAICSVVPSIDYSVKVACLKYFKLKPLQLKVGIKTGIKLAIKNPLEVGADRIANAVAATEMFPNKNLILLDFGTASTVCAVSNKKEFLGGAIMPGMKVAMQSLYQHAAKLSPVDIVAVDHALGKTTEHNIQAGLYYAQLGAAKELINHIKAEAFAVDNEVVVLATGGFAKFFEAEQLFDVNIPDLVLDGMRIIAEKN